MRQYYNCYNVSIVFTCLVALGMCCDEFSWEEIGFQFEKCVNRTQKELLATKKYANLGVANSDEYCRKLNAYLSCPSILTVCEDEPLQDQEDLLLKKFIVDKNLEESLEFCQNLNVVDSRLQGRRLDKRSPIAKKRGGSRGSSRTSSSNRGRVSSSIRSAFSGKTGRKGQKVLGTILGSKKGKGVFGTGRKSATKGVKRKGSFLRKAGKYAVVGLAAYGTYKLAKKMSKGLRRSYDDDDCWDYSYISGRYSCTCSNQCDVYVGAAHSISSTYSLLFFSLAFSIMFRLL